MSVELDKGAADASGNRLVTRGRMAAAIGILAASVALGVGAFTASQERAGYVAQQQKYEGCAAYVDSITEKNDESPRVEYPAAVLPADVFLDCKIPGAPEDHAKQPGKANSYITVVNLPSVDDSRALSSVSEKSAADVWGNRAGKTTLGVLATGVAGSIAGAAMVGKRNG